MNVKFTDAQRPYVSMRTRDANVMGYRMFEAVLVIFTNQFFFDNPIQSLHGVQNETKPVSS